jgi:hypothetical protein
VQKRGIKRVLFSSRDGELWMKVFRKFTSQVGLSCEIEYFCSSRLARRFASLDYIAYARDRLSDESLLIDLCGTGWSIAHLFKTLGLQKRPVFMLLQLPKFPSLEKGEPAPDTCELHFGHWAGGQRAG